MSEACRAFGLPVVGGNVSLYNASEGTDIDPTPVVGVLGLVDDLQRRAPRRRPGRRRAAPARSVRSTTAWAAPSGPGPPAGPARATCRPSTSSATRRWPTSSAAWSSTGWWPACTTWPAAGSAWPWPRWPSPPASASRVDGVADHRGLFSEAPSRVVVCVAPDREAEVLARAEAAGRPGPCPRHRRRRPPGGRGPGRRRPRRGHRHLAEPPPRRPGRRRLQLGAGSSERAGRVARLDPVTPPPDDALDDGSDGKKEACGVFGVYAPDQPVAHLLYLGLYALQHRGQESAGMAVSSGDDITVVKDMGLVATVFDDRTLQSLARPPGHRPHPLLDLRLVATGATPSPSSATPRPASSPSATTATWSTPRPWPTRPGCCRARSPATATSSPS